MREWFGRFIRGRAFAVLFSLVVLGFSVYFSNRLGRLSTGFFGVNVAPGVLLFLVAMFTYMLIYINSTKPDKRTRTLFNHCGELFCFFPSIILCFLVFDALQGVMGPFDRRWYGLPLLVGIGISAYGFVHARRLTVKEYTVPLSDGEGAFKEVRAVLLSDLHAGSYVDRAQLQNIVAETNALAPDMVLIAGDTFDHEAFGHCDMAGIHEALCDLAPKEGVYAVLGNHDPASDTAAVRTFFEEAGICLLVDEWVETDAVVLAGRDDIVTNPARVSLEALLREAPVDKPLLVMDHNPLGLAEADSAGATLTVCGHTHKGQFFPATLFTKWAYGARGFYGHHVRDGHHSVVTSGAGYFQLPVRIGTDSEIVLLHLV